MSSHLMKCSHEFYSLAISLTRLYLRPPNASTSAFSNVFGNRLYYSEHFFRAYARACKSGKLHEAHEPHRP